MEHRKIGSAVGGGNNDLTVDDRGACVDVPSVRGNLSKAVGPVVAATGEDLHRGVSEMNLHAVAVELDLVDPPVAGWDLIDRRRQLRFDEPRVGRLDADRRRLSPLERHSSKLHATRCGFKPSQSGSFRVSDGGAPGKLSCAPAGKQPRFSVAIW